MLVRIQDSRTMSQNRNLQWWRHRLYVVLESIRTCLPEKTYFGLRFEIHASYAQSLELPFDDTGIFQCVSAIPACVGQINTSPSMLCTLDLSNTAIRDEDLICALQFVTKLKNLNLRNCVHLRHPELLSTFNAEVLQLDGSWRIDEDMIETLLRRHKQEGGDPQSQMSVDICETLKAGDLVQVVILSREFEGEWVDAILLDGVSSSLEYNIYVNETTQYLNAVGFSGRPALNVHRKHLRYRPRQNGTEKDDFELCIVKNDSRM